MKTGDYVTVNAEGGSYNGIVMATREGNCPWQVECQDTNNRTWHFEHELTVRPMTRDDVIRSTAKHIRRVGALLLESASCLTKRAIDHDRSKWSEQEWPAFEATTPKLAGLTYGTEEYRASLREIQPALKHHYANNSHHPEHYANGIESMTLEDLIEMLCDWKAAGERHADGSMAKSLKQNAERFKIPSAMMVVLINTCAARQFISAAEREELLLAKSSAH